MIGAMSWRVVGDSKGKIRGDRAHEKLVALGYGGTDRTTRRALAEIKSQWRLGNTRVHRPWITEPGLWLQYDFGDGRSSRDARSCCSWRGWRGADTASWFRCGIGPHRVCSRAGPDLPDLGGAPTYLLTDNEKTVTTGHIAGVPVRNRHAVTFGRYYGISVLTCQPADPASKGGVENAVKLAKADIVPTDTNLLAQYDTFADVQEACSSSTPRSTSACTAPRVVVPWRCLSRNAPHCTVCPICRTPRPWRDPPSPRQHPDGHLRALPILHAGNTIGPQCLDPSSRRHRRSRDLRTR